jgi:uncharacterized Zn finger protein
MCKHVAATLYGVGARLDHDPDLLFHLRGVDRSELVSIGADLSITEAAVRSERVLAADNVAALFGLEFEVAPPAAAAKDTTPTTKPAITDAQQARSASVPMRAAKGGATKASSESEPQADRKSASKSGRVSSATKANSGADARRAHGARSGRETSASEAAVKEAESAWTPKTARNAARTHSTSAEANRKAPSGRAADRSWRNAT